MSAQEFDRRAAMYATEAMKQLRRRKAEVTACVSSGSMPPEDGIREIDRLTEAEIVTAFAVGYSSGLADGQRGARR